jgi:hypothetical protein
VDVGVGHSHLNETSRSGKACSIRPFIPTSSVKSSGLAEEYPSWWMGSHGATGRTDFAILARPSDRSDSP